MDSLEKNSESTDHVCGTKSVHAVSVIECICCAFSAQRNKSSVASLDPEGLNVEVGDQVLVAGQKNGIVRFYGKTDFAPGPSTVHQLFLYTPYRTLCTVAQ